MSIRLVVAKGSGPTGQLLTELLRERGVRVGGADAQAVVSYGCALRTELPSLNAKAGAMDKMQQAVELARQNVATVSVLTPHQAEHSIIWPLLGRKRQHKGGTDILVCKWPNGVRRAVERGREWFTPVLESNAEFRCWIYRGRHLGTYKKVLRYPRRQKTFGRNRRNGYAFELVRAGDVPREGVDLGVAAVRALGLDFGAVDVLRCNDGRYVVLEVNTAPGVEGPRQVITALADKIAKWEQKGYPKRRGEGDNVEQG